ncbi:hypothetical protein [Conexibacter sp. CPCC 206217]|uniref:hypothetical protein n=1 Tax=Conexibacter sp. CPCC 206217 TaxID=3064574 RepID=UPI0027193A2E|nr:hypothetical protein [Conexibacter sp. CPCC 206217]MDO8211887.1 hypothetical protein [Conexibacter sp. CPCC 206217]
MYGFLVFAAEGAADHGSKTAFYIAGLALAACAVLIGALGVARPAFAEGEGTSRAVIGLVLVLMIATLAAAIATSS